MGRILAPDRLGEGHAGALGGRVDEGGALVV
jgi:hypothetical protein